MLEVMDKNKGGIWEQKEYRYDNGSGTPTLNEIGIDRHQSSNWQRIARIPEAEFERHIEETKKKEKEVE